MENKVISRKQAAEYLGVGLSTFDKQIKAGEIPCFRIGKRIMLTTDSLEAWIQGKLRESMNGGKQE